MPVWLSSGKLKHMRFFEILIQAWPIWLVMAFLIWARSRANQLHTDPPRGPVILILMLVLLINLNQIELPLIWYSLCLPPMAYIIWKLRSAPEAE